MRFQFFIGGYSSGHFEVVLKNDELCFFVSDYPMQIERQEPTQIISIKGDIEWQNLMKFIADIKWKRKYESDILDGTQWELTFKNETKKMNCYGNNAFPADFDNFITLLKKITTKHKIPDELLEDFRSD
ncbi:MAG: hypothetical protein IPN99_16250 [Bacteroidetes bacterium]|nr:hypothetical protein [Bacteroidota bacterium]